MNNAISHRLEALRSVMRQERLGACIFPSTDAHQSEYVAPHWQGREWISGFRGSAGTAVVTLTGAALWTDSRYFLAAEEQLRGTEYQLMRLKMPGTPTIAEWIGRQMALQRDGSTEVAIDGMVWSAAQVATLTAELRLQGGLTLRTNLDALGRIWADRPAIPLHPIELHPLQFSGETTASKIARLRRKLREQHADGMLMSSLDDIAWTLNLRGTDIHRTPVFVAYLLVSTTTVTLFTDRRKITPVVAAYLEDNGIGTDDYANVRKGLADYFEQNILMDPDETSHTLMRAATRQVVRGVSPVPCMKIVKNATEQQGFRRAMERDGVAMVRFLKWMEERMADSNAADAPLTEMGVDRKLTSLRAVQTNYRDLSFDTIAGYGSHGAIVHYEATPATDAPLHPEGLLLLDSGAQYLDGTTDITRTIALGPLTADERHVYTLVLKGHIALARAIFPEGSSGTQLDVLARQFMWREGLNYLHGTGHGVGSYLCVHEGPHQFRMEWKPQPLLPGMTITCEPGIYLAGRFGVRIENTMLVVPHPGSGFFPLGSSEADRQRFVALEPLTLCPIDKRPIDVAMLTDDERDYLNGYHQLVYSRLSPLLSADEQSWLRQACSAL